LIAIHWEMMIYFTNHIRWSYLRGRPSCINRQILFVERAQPKACRSNSYHSETESLARHWRLDFSNSVTFSPGAFAELGRGRCRKTNPGIDQRLECREGVGYRGGEVLLPGRRRRRNRYDCMVSNRWAQ
jgi:hypothetical protein